MNIAPSAIVKIIKSVVLALLLLLGVLLLVTYLSRSVITSQAIQHFAASELRLNIDADGETHLGFDGTKLIVEIEDASARIIQSEVASSETFDHPLLSVSDLRVQVDLKDVFENRISIEEVSASKTTVNISDSVEPWLQQIKAGGSETTAPPMQVLFRKLLLENTTVHFANPLFEHVDKVGFPRVSVSDQDGENNRQLDVDVILLGEESTLSGRFSNIEEFITKAEPSTFELTGNGNNWKMESAGLLSDFENKGLTQFKWNVELVRVPDWIAHIDPRTALIKTLKASGELSANSKQISIDKAQIAVASQTGDLSLNTRGLLTLADEQGNLAWHFNGDTTYDFKDIKPFFGESPDVCSVCSSLNGKLTFMTTDQEFIFDELAIALGLGRDKLEYEAANLTIESTEAAGNIARISTSGASVKYYYDQLIYGYSSENSVVELLSEKELSWRSKGAYLGIPVQLEGHSSAIDGPWSHHIEGDIDDAPIKLVFADVDSLPQLDVDLSVPDVELLSRLLLRPKVDMDSATLRAKVRFGEKVEVSSFDLFVAGPNHEVSLTGVVGDLLNFDPYSLKLGIEAKRAGTLNKWLGVNTVPLAKTIESFTEESTFAENRKKSEAEKLKDPWFSELIDVVDVPGWLAIFPLNDGALSTRLDVIQDKQDIDVRNLNVTLKQNDTNVVWNGELLNLQKSESIEGKLEAVFDKDFWVWQKAPLKVTTTTEGDFELFKLVDINLTDDYSLVKGEVDLNMAGDGLKIQGALTTPELDLRNWMKSPGEVSVADATGVENDFALPEIPDLLLTFDELSDFDINIELKADKVDGYWLHFSNFVGGVVIEPGQMSMDIDGDLTEGRVQLVAEIVEDKGKHFGSLLFTGYDIGRKDMPLEDPPLNIESGSFDALFRITSQGRYLKEILADSNGQFTLSAQDLHIKGDFLDSIAPDIVASTITRINPFSDENKNGTTEVECGIVHFNIKNGKWVADDSIQIVTPKLGLMVQGEMDFKKEHVRFLFSPQSREGLGLSLSGTLTDMAVIEGPMQDPTVSVAPYEVLKQGSVSVVGMALLGPLYAIPYGQYNKYMSGPEDCIKEIKQHPVSRF